MEKEEKKLEERIVLMEESSAPVVSAANFEPDKDHSLIYFKFAAMNQPALKSTPIPNHISDSRGYLVYGTINDLREYLHLIIDRLVDQAGEGAKLNP